MKNGRSPHFYLAIFWFLIALTAFCSGATPERPYYSETPNPRHIQNNDRLTAEYFNNQLNVIYNWAQRTNAELDNLLHNGLGVASLTVGILNCTNKIINPEWDNLLHNGNGVASITANLVKAQDLEIANSIDVPAIEFSGRSQPTPPVDNGMLYFDSDLQRFRVYQEDGWRDLSSNYIIDGTTLTNPLVIDGYLDTKNIYVNNNASVSKNLYVGENINSSGTATIQNVNILNDSTINRNLTVKGNLNSSGTANLKNLNVTDNTTINKNLIVKGKLNASGPAVLESVKANKTLKVPTTASTTLGIGSVYYDTTAGKLKVLNSSNTWDTVGNDIAVDSAMSSTSTNAVQNKTIKSYVDQNTVSAVAQGSNNGTIAVTKNGTTSNVSVKGLGTAAYTASTDYATANHNHDSSYISSVSEGTANGTISVTKNGNTSSVTVHGLGSAAYTNIDSAMNASSTNPVQNKIVKSYVDSAVSGSGGNIPVTPPSNPSAGQMYYDSNNKVMKFWDGTEWKVVANRDSIIVRNNVSPSSETDCTVSDTTVVLYRKYSTGNSYEVMISGFVSQSSATSYFHYPSGLTMWLTSDSGGTTPVITLTVENSNPDKSFIGVASCGGSSVIIETYDNDGESRRTGKYYFIIRGTCMINSAQADWL